MAMAAVTMPPRGYVGYVKVYIIVGIICFKKKKLCDYPDWQSDLQSHRPLPSVS
jgi:hypothetical protein